MAYIAARTALASLYQGLSDIESAHAAMTAPYLGGRKVIEGNVTRHEIPDNRRAEVANAMGQSFNRIAHTVEANNVTVAESVAMLSKRVEQSLINPRRNEVATAQNAAEIRQHIRSLPEGKRMDFLHAAIKQGDHEVATAVIGASCFTSGLNREQHETIRGLASGALPPERPHNWRPLAKHTPPCRPQPRPSSSDSTNCCRRRRRRRRMRLCAN